MIIYSELVEPLYFKIFSNSKNTGKSTNQDSGTKDDKANLQKVAQIVGEEVEANKEVFCSTPQPICHR